MKIAITGIGIISSLGVGKDANREKLLAGTECVGPAEVLNTEHKEWPVGEVGLTNRQLKLLTSQNPSMELTRTALLGMVAAMEAAEDARLTQDDIHETHLVSGTTVGGMDLAEEYATEWAAGDFSNVEIIQQHAAGVSTAMISAYLGGFADTNTTSTACSSALNAMIVGANMLRIGAAKRVMVGGTEALSKFHVNGFAALGILSQSVCKPFQDDRDGINLGEGAAYLVIEEEETALKRGAHIYGYLAGYGNTCDAYHATASSPEGDGAYAAMKEALEMARLQPSDVHYINAHGTATPNNDASESRAIERLFGEKAFFTSTKNLTGHTTSASGSIEAIFCLMYMQEKGYPCVMSNAFGFGGNDSSIVLTNQGVELPALPGIDGQVVQYVVEVNEDADTKPYMPVMQARRLTKQMKRMVVAAKQALEQAGVDCPDAIVAGTEWGGMQPSAQLLQHLVENGEADMSPALFMQSTHNSIAGTLAILLKAKGYNCTFSHGKASYAEAEADGVLQIMLGKAKSVLVCEFEEEAEHWQEYLTAAGTPAKNRARAVVFKLGE